jgi:DNA polymerase-1
METFLINGRLHATFTPNKREVGGAVTGRLAASKPALQQIPAREMKHNHESYAQEMRALFLPEDGMLMLALDYAQIEARILAHYGIGPQAETFRQMIRDGADYHKIVMALTGIASRDAVKRIDFAAIYGAGWQKILSTSRYLFKTLAAAEGVTPEEYVQRVYNTFHARFPVVRDTMTYVQNITASQGYVRDFCGRNHHKPKGQMVNGKWNMFLYKMLNHLIQGAASGVLKRGLVDAQKAGIFDVLTLHLTVHDENVVSMPYNKIGAEAAVEFKRIMKEAYKERINVPLDVSAEAGNTWGTWRSDIWEEVVNGVFNRSPYTLEVL